ncbi:glycosyltransferase family 4 protein [Abditibacterium utsteinense]|uniref:glycosyltransferase family 4 protein n=1 Tax=Abditibacterium utsteinense TaxID=1960156 RepID=UPI00130099C6|nr:glycosyltransferase family 4 protein [Abditibacterium utsteinense]
MRTSINGAFAVSDFTSRWIEECYGYNPGEVKTLYNAVDSNHFRPASVPPFGVPIINFVGRTGREKAPDLLLRACLELSRKTTDFELQIVGSNYWDKFEMDEYQQELLSLTTELEKRGVRVTRPGHIGRAMLPEIIRRAHIHVVPSRWDEPFGLTTLEGMACGLATVGSATGGTPEVIGDAGLLFERDNVAQLTAHLELLVRDQTTRLNYTKRARERAEQFSWERCWDNLSSLIAT